MSDPAINHARCIAISGPDARAFAQAQFAADVRRLEPWHWQWNTWLDAQGRVVALMHLIDVADGTLLALLRGGDAAGICERLARFRLRARVALAVRTFGGRAAGPADNGCVARSDDGYCIGYGDRSFRLCGAIEERSSTADDDAWHRADIRAGWPSLPIGSTRFLPPALSLTRLGAVAIDKGCYPGQEVVARLQHRGGHKRRLFHVRGAVVVPRGHYPAANDQGAIDVLDSSFSNGLAELLAVASVSTSRTINILQHNYDVVSKFDA